MLFLATNVLAFRFKELDEDLDELGSKELSLAPKGITGATLDSNDDDVVTTEPMLTDEDILAACNGDEDALQFPADDVDEDVQPPRANDINDASEVLQSIALFT